MRNFLKPTPVFIHTKISHEIFNGKEALQIPLIDSIPYAQNTETTCSNVEEASSGFISYVKSSTCSMPRRPPLQVSSVPMDPGTPSSFLQKLTQILWSSEESHKLTTHGWFRHFGLQRPADL
ncbi:unnamed protein product [Nyctereutes procyonoides]|uniref:(raccoon dog) hypothetical protein n=1 Tax=Nyctereutes procyonoides TaxID=34880 RepID=A0A811ZJB5_NYCPR|nr:unnamed protein product [Nyctereutes procyonoides]